MSVADHALRPPANTTILPPPVLANQTQTNTTNATTLDGFTVRHTDGATFLEPLALKANPSLTELKVGVLLPFHQQNNNWTKELTLSGTSAIRLAADEINRQQLIPGAYITLVEKDSYPKDVDGQQAITQAVFSAVSLIQEGVVAVIGDISSSWTSLSALMTSTLQIPQCSFTAVADSLSDKTQYGYFFRTVQTNLLYADAALSFIVSQGWPVIGILYTSDDTGQQLAENMIMKSKLKGVHVKAYERFYRDGPNSDIYSSIEDLMAHGVGVVFVAADGDAQLAALIAAGHQGHINNGTVWITMGTLVDDLYTATTEFNAALANRTVSSAPLMNPQKSITSTTATNTTNTTNTTSIFQHIAQVTTVNTPLDFNRTFSGGIFTFETMMDLSGYPPYDAFLQKWKTLDPELYPFAGTGSITSNEGLAYSCMMVMAYGFNQTINNATDTADARQRLAKGQMGDSLQPATFNTSFVGPNGPMMFDQNGDVMLGNFHVLNLQNGTEVAIGNIMAGDLTLTQPPVYHDQSTTPPSGIPTQTALNPGFTSPMAITIVSFVSFGAFLALAMMTVVMLYRKHEVFKASSPLFCVLELIGFTLCYVSTLFFMAFRSKFDCIMIPITFHVGLSLVLANLIAKNYRIYRIFNNIFITRTVVTDLQLLKVSGSMILVETILLVLWLCTSDITTIHVPVSFTAYIVGCSYQGPGTKIYVALLTIMAAGQLAFATFLAIKTRAVGKSYSKYSEYRQIGISVYNIFFSALIGFVIYSVPTMDYYTRHYLTGFTVVWATTFSMLILFLPKMHAFFFGKQKSSGAGKHSDLTGRVRATPHGSGNGGGLHVAPRPQETTTFMHQELISLNHMIATPGAMDPLFANENNPTSKNKTVLEAHEARMPVQVVCKYIPFLAAWDMKHIFLLPRVGYFSFFSEKSHKGQVFSYSDASVVSSTEGAYIFRVRGRRLFDVHIQVASPEDLEQWCAWFNSTKGTASGALIASNNTASFLSSSRGTAPTAGEEESKDMELRELTRKKNNLTAERHLLDRQESNITLESVDTCMHAPVLQPMDPQLNNTVMNVPSALAPRLSESFRRRRTASNGTTDSHHSSTVEDRRRVAPSSMRLPALETSSPFSDEFLAHEPAPPTTATVATPGSERTVVVDDDYDNCKHVQ